MSYLPSSNLSILLPCTVRPSILQSDIVIPERFALVISAFVKLILPKTQLPHRICAVPYGVKAQNSSMKNLFFKLLHLHIEMQPSVFFAASLVLGRGYIRLTAFDILVLRQACYYIKSRRFLYSYYIVT